MNFIDIHNHFAWDIDDGMESREQAEIALKKAYADGVRMIVSTPHFIPGQQDKNDVAFMNQRIEELKVLAKQYGIEVFSGSEIFLNDDFLDMLDQELFNTLAGSGYALCEFDVRKDIEKNEEAENVLYEFEVRNMIPVIAHAERYFHKGLNLNRIQEWMSNGYVIQINRTSLLGMHGETAKKNAWKLIHSGMAHVVASDAHRADGNRVCKLSDAYEMVVKEVGKENADILFYRNPLHLIQNEEIEDLHIVKKKSFFDIFKRR